MSVTASPLFRPALRLELTVLSFDKSGVQLSPKTKKNHSRIVQPRGWKRPLLLPSEAYVEWCDGAKRAMALVLPEIASEIPIAYEVNCRARIYRSALIGDAIGYYQGLADFLEDVGIVADDKWIVSWDGSRLEKDAGNPRIELTLEEIR